ncbi:hypothetical protein B0H63DRAFT_455286 [Podospora didyma]|uniref:Uncharacterized protein n=1 Tax=Podospora didyma TaxID=330526 RepID=A0AAE0K2R8_9PEZI|nr:hypothetical protein B0H63DRAFT_455286 [Podospora didyma]
MVVNASPNPANIFLPAPNEPFSLANMKTAGTFQTSDPVFLGFYSHVPSIISPTAKQIRCGFWAEANALQGHRDTYYVGAAWSADYTPVIWTHAAILLQQMMA